MRVFDFDDFDRLIFEEVLCDLIVDSAVAIDPVDDKFSLCFWDEGIVGEKGEF